MSAKGEINLAPYSYFNAVSADPPIVLFSSEGRKDSVTFIEETGEFVCSLATYELRDAVNETSAPMPRGANEMTRAGLEAAPSQLVRPPRVAASPCALECKLLQIIPLRDLEGKMVDKHLVFGQVVGVFVEDSAIRHDGLLDIAAIRPIARCGYHDYAIGDQLFQMMRPKS